MLAQGRCLAFDKDKLTIGFDREFDAEALRDRLDALREALTEILGAAPAIEIIVGSAEDVTRTETLIEVEARKLDEDRELRRRESLRRATRPAPPIAPDAGGRADSLVPA